MRDALRLAVGTLTVVPGPPPRRVDRTVGSWAMVLAPLVGALLGAGAALVLAAVGQAASPLLAAALTVGLLALLTRGMHLDGLADTADGLGSGRPAEQALEIMRRGDVGPFGVVTLVLTLLVQVSALAQLTADGRGPAALAAAVVVSRLSLPLACSRGVPPARRDGLGQAVAGSVGRGQALLALALTVALLASVAAAAVGWGGVSGGSAVELAAAAPVGLLAGMALVWRCVRRLGGVTGDVLGASVETTLTGALVVLALLT